MAVNLEQFYEAISLMQGNDPERCSTATLWLEDFQKSVYAWTLADQILIEARSFDACLFAAQTIRNKVLYSLQELPRESYSTLRDSLLSQLCNVETKLGRNCSSILTQLCAALSDLYIQVVDWRGFLVQMVAHLSASNQTQSVLLSFFKTLPEELYNKKLKVGENRRAEVELELAQQTETVLANLYHLCAMDSSGISGIRTQAVNCLASWLLNKRCPTEILAASPLLQSVIACLGQPSTSLDLHDAATECMVNALQLIDDSLSPETQSLAKLLQQGIFSTLDAFRTALREEDSEKLQNYARIFAEHCETFLTEIAKNPSSSEGFGNLHSLDMLQLANDHHDYTLMEMSFNVWYRLSEYLYQCDEVEFEELRNVFCPYVEKHTLALCRHCRMEPDSQELLDGRSELADFRTKAQESIKDVTFIMGSVEMLRRLMGIMNISNSWDQMESILFIINAFIPNIIETERLVVPMLLEAILKLPVMGTPKMLLKTSAQLLGSLQDWLQGNADYMVRSFTWLCSLFVLPVVGGASLALTVAECMDQLMERGWQEVQRRGLGEKYMRILSDMLGRVEQATTRAQDMEQAAQHLLKASAHLINDLPAPQLCACLEHLCARSVEKLNEINRLASVPPDPQPSSANAFGDEKENIGDPWVKLSTDPVLWLDRLSAIWRIIKPWQQQLDFQQQSNERDVLATDCPWLSLCSTIVECALCTLHQHQKKQRTVEHSCRTIRFLIRSMGAQSIGFIEPLAQEIMLTYRQYPHSCLLYLSSILVDEYGAMGHIQLGLLTMLESLASRSLQLLASDPNNGFRDNPDTVDDLYRLAIRFVQRCPSTLFAHQIADQLFQGAIHGLTINHIDANRSLSKFVLELINVARGKRCQSISETDVQRVTRMISDSGHQLMFSVISAALFHLSNSLCKEMAEIIASLIAMDEQKVEQWLNYTCQQLPQTGGHSATPEQLDRFRKQILSAKRPYDIVTVLRELSKFYA